MAIRIRDTGNNAPTNQSLIISQDALLEYNITSDDPIEEVDVEGLLRPFYHDWDPDTGKLKVIGRPGSIEELDVMIKVKDENGNTESAGFHLSVTNVRPIIVDPGTLIFNYGREHEFPITIHNFPSIVEVRGTWLGLEASPEDPGVIIRGSLPAKSVASPGKRKGEFEIIARNSSPQFDRFLADWIIATVFSGSFTRVGNVFSFRGNGVNESDPRGLTVNSNTNTYYMVGGGRFLSTVDVSTSIATRVGSSTINDYSLGGLAYDPNSNTLYLAGNYLYTVNTTTGVATRVGRANAYGVSEFSPGGLTFDPNNNILYMVGNSRDALYTVNTTTGVATRVGRTTQFGVRETTPWGLAYNAFENVLYMVGAGTNALYTVNTTTGAATRVGNVSNFGVGESLPRGLTFNNSTDEMYMTGRIIATVYKAN